MVWRTWKRWVLFLVYKPKCIQKKSLSMYISHAELNTLKSVFILVFFPAKGIDLQGIKWMVHFSWLRVIHISADTRRGGLRKYKFWCQRIYGWSIHPLKQVIFVWKAFLVNLFIWKKSGDRSKCQQTVSRGSDQKKCQLNVSRGV